MLQRKQPSLHCLTLIVIFATSTAVSEDYPQWRGTHRDGILNEPGLMRQLPEGNLPRQWSVPVGPGYSGPTVSDHRVFLTDRGVDPEQADQERVLCFDAKTGEIIWSHSYEAKYNDDRHNIGYKAGPRAAVTIHAGMALSVGAMGHMKCFKAETGDLIWQHDLAEEYSIQMPI